MNTLVITRDLAKNIFFNNAEYLIWADGSPITENQIYDDFFITIYDDNKINIHHDVDDFIIEDLKLDIQKLAIEILSQIQHNETEDFALNCDAKVILELGWEIEGMENLNNLYITRINNHIALLGTNPNNDDIEIARNLGEFGGEDGFIELIEKSFGK